MEAQHCRVVVAIENKHLRDQIVELLDNPDFEVIAIPAHDLYSKSVDFNVLILQTNNDVAAMNQIVYGLYSSCAKEERLQIIGLLAKEAMDANPKVCGWDINNHAALAALIPLETEQLEPQKKRELLEFVKRLARI